MPASGSGAAGDGDLGVGPRASVGVGETALAGQDGGFGREEKTVAEVQRWFSADDPVPVG
jgi:hypothetical protein